MTKLLLDRGAAIEGVNSGDSALQWALVYYQPDFALVRLLISRGADVNRKSADGTTVLDRAIDNNNPDLVGLLLACGADPAMRQKRDYSSGLRFEVKPPDFEPKFAALRQRPVRLIKQTNVACNRAVFALDPTQGDLRNWTSRTLGRLPGPLQCSRTPSGRAYLGPFGQQAVTLKLTGLPKHGNVHVEVELFVIGSWDGNGGAGPGPDLIDIQIANVGTLLHSTFLNDIEDETAGLPMQSFPDPYPFGYHKAYTGAWEVHTLGFTGVLDGRQYRRDAAYKLRYTFAHSESDLEVVITGDTVIRDAVHNLTDGANWGIGSFVVNTD